MFENVSLVIVGAFRSGTNAMNETLERNYFCSPKFNQYFWRHCIPPHHEKALIPSKTGVICMVRDPIEWNKSLFRFWHARRKELMPSSKISEFIRDPFILYDNTNGFKDIRYHFNSPIDYWNKYYYAWSFWENIRDQLVFVRLDDFELHTESTLNIIEKKFSLKRKPLWRPSLPSLRVGPSVPNSIDGLSNQLSSADIEFIQNNCLPDLKYFFNYQ